MLQLSYTNMFGLGADLPPSTDLPGFPPDPAFDRQVQSQQATAAQVDHEAKIAAIVGTGLVLHSMLRVPLAIVDGIHGYKRNNGDGASAAVWGILGLLFPIITTSTAVIQGYGKPKK